MTDKEQPSVEVTQEGAATEAATLEQHVMNPNIPKNEAGWWARSQIENLRAQLAKSESRVRVLREALEAAPTAAELAEILPRTDEVTAKDRKLGKEAAFILACDGSDGELCAVDLARDLRIFLHIRTLKDHPNEQA